MSDQDVPILPIVLDENEVVKLNDDKTITIPKDNIKQLDLLEKDCTASQVTGVIIVQINGLQKDIQELEVLKESLKNIFPSDPRSYRSSFVVENKVKTFTGFYSTILSYKKELNALLLKLREILNVGTDLEKYKQAIREVIIERSNTNASTEHNKQKIDDLLKKAPNLMPTSL